MSFNSFLRFSAHPTEGAGVSERPRGSLLPARTKPRRGASKRAHPCHCHRKEKLLPRGLVGAGLQVRIQLTVAEEEGNESNKHHG